MSPSASTSGWPGSVRSGSTGTRPARSSSAPVGSPSAPASAGRGHAGRPDHGARRDPLASPSRRLDRHRRRRRCPTTVRVEQRRDAEPLERRARPCARATAGRSSARGRPPRRAAPAPARGSIARKSRRSVSRASSAIWPAISTPVGPAPTTTNVSQARAALGVGLELGRLERAEDPAADVERALERLHLRRHLAHSSWPK